MTQDATTYPEQENDVLHSGKPPKKLSDLLKAAVATARQLDRDTYLPNALVWHAEFETDWGTKMCHICFAGAFAAGKLGIRKDSTFSPSGTEQSDWSAALVALDLARDGAYRRAMWTIGQNTPDDFDNQNYGGRPEHSQFFKWEQFDSFLIEIEDAAAKLAEDGF